jgi:hypothetical protein
MDLPDSFDELHALLRQKFLATEHCFITNDSLAHQRKAKQNRYRFDKPHTLVPYDIYRQKHNCLTPPRVANTAAPKVVADVPDDKSTSSKE